MKLLATDLDGTLLKRNTISEENLLALETFKNEGNKVAIATGRPLCATSHLKNAINYDYAITANGAMVTDRRNKVLFKATILDEVVFDLVSSLDYDVELFVSNGEVILNREDYLNNPIKEVIFLSVTPKSNKLSDTLKIKEKIAAKYELGLVLNKAHLDISAVGINKANGIAHVVKRLKIQNEDVMVFGDQDNDISMFENYPNSYYIYGGSKNLRKHATNKVFNVSDVIEYKKPFDVL